MTRELKVSHGSKNVGTREHAKTVIIYLSQFWHCSRVRPVAPVTDLLLPCQTCCSRDRPVAPVSDLYLPCSTRIYHSFGIAC